MVLYKVEVEHKQVFGGGKNVYKKKVPKGVSREWALSIQTARRGAHATLGDQYAPHINSMAMKQGHKQPDHFKSFHEALNNKLNRFYDEQGRMNSRGYGLDPVEVKNFRYAKDIYQRRDPLRTLRTRVKMMNRKETDPFITSNPYGNMKEHLKSLKKVIDKKSRSRSRGQSILGITENLDERLNLEEKKPLDTKTEDVIDRANNSGKHRSFKDSAENADQRAAPKETKKKKKGYSKDDMEISNQLISTLDTKSVLNPDEVKEEDPGYMFNEK
jgi:hypothetical protein